jgi:glycosyltransferase involved in cell wall biosynthesis
MSISVVIPSYKNPQCLDLCLRSAFENQINDNQIIAIIDGFPELYDEVLKKYPGLNVLVNEQNKGQTYCHNTGVMLAENDKVLIVNDDNVLPWGWDERLLPDKFNENVVLTPNQVEPTPSIFKSFICKDFGRTPETFEYEKFIKEERFDMLPARGEFYTPDGQTWPIFMSKKWYMILGGIELDFPSPAVADWSFFMRCEMAGLTCLRYHGLHFYHFAGISTKQVGNSHQHKLGESNSFHYFANKWGFYPQRDEFNRVLWNSNIRGIKK